MRVRADIVRVYKSLHTWTGLLAGMALFIAFFAGSLTMFKEPLNRWATPPQAQAAWPEQAQWPGLIEQVLAGHPELAREGFVLHLRPDASVPAPLTWTVRDDAGHDSHLARQDRHWAGLDGQGALLTGQDQPSPMATLIDYLHQTAGIPGDGHHLFGVYVMGVISVLYFLALVSGLIVLLPTLVKDFLAMRPGRNLKRFWLDAHNAIGITSLPFHIVIALTVIVFAFHDLIYDGLQVAVYGDRPMFARERPAEGAPRDIRDMKSPDELLAELRRVAPDFRPREMMYARVTGQGASVRVTGEDDGRIMRGAARGFATMDPYRGTVTDTDYLPGHQQGYIVPVTSFFALHFGNFGGDPVRWLYFLLGLSGAFLFYTGNLLWIEARRRRQRRDSPLPEQRRSTRLMASATVGVCWGAVAGVACAMTAGKWLQAGSADITSVYLTTYYAVFLAAVSWAFLAGPARALVHLLAFCALALLSIPATAVLAWLLPALPAWAHADAASLAVELTALVLALCFAIAARKAYRRAWHGEPDSVWSARADR